MEANKSAPSSANSPHLEVIDRVKNIPVIHSAIEKTGSTYSYVKDSHHLVNWALNYAEAGLNTATAKAATLAAPLTKKFEGQISAVDQKLCQGLDIVEQKVPIVKEPPQQIYDAVKAVMQSSLQPTIEKLNAAKESATQQASTLKEISIAKANELLDAKNTSESSCARFIPSGEKTVQVVDNTSELVNRLLDRYFPPVEGKEESTPEPVSAEENKVLHILQTLGQMSSKTTNRVYHSIAAQLKTVRKEDVANYISNVVNILHFTQFLHLGHGQEHQQASSSPTEDKKKK
ncbi:lipid storage droplets surface-binding protein 2-like isoform X2 [Pseudomyrmex gracilis]|uniref:lipid storage droplets surface-binding protein 2-like isoform X2 n=1 Tax=Pseudomyrmex gracilis TaxID=219809 RepID=UPI000995B677|nr:lipid storage droplets surface-binding protein 2-like isoform X2 [Pseudomyrmex gracilis]